MAANDNVTGRLTLWAGKTFGQARQISPDLQSGILDNAVGSNAYTLCPAGKVYEEIPLNSVRMNLPAGPHLLEGENLYIAMDPDVDAKAIDSTGAAGTVVKFQYALRDRATGRVEIKSEVSETNRNTTTTTGGIKDDMTIYKGRPNALYAFLLTPAGSDAMVLGHIQVDVRTTA